MKKLKLTAWAVMSDEFERLVKVAPDAVFIEVYPTKQRAIERMGDNTKTLQIKKVQIIEL